MERGALISSGSRLLEEVTDETGDRPLLVSSEQPPRTPRSATKSTVQGHPLHDRSTWVIDPNTSFTLHVWDVLNCSSLIAISFVAPFETAFLEPDYDWLLALNCGLDTFFIADLCMQFFIAYSDPVHPERLVKDHKRVAKHYLGTWFVVDFLSALPVDIWRVAVSRLWKSFTILPGFEDLKFLRLIRLLRLTRLARLFARWQTSFGFSYANLSLTRFVAVVLFCCHWMACLWGAIANIDAEDPDRRSWLTALEDGKGGSHDLYEGPWQVYNLSMYWAIITITSIGYGDITPQTHLEYWVATFCTSIMASIWAYVIGAVCGIVSTMSPHEMAFKRTMDDLNWLMCQRGMPYEMCQKMRRYFQETRDMNRQRTEQELMERMSPKLQGEYAHFMHQRWIAKVWYLRNMNHEIIVWASRHVTMAVYSPHEEVLSDRTLFIVQRGLCALRGKVLTSGDVWGEDMLLSNEFLREQQKARSLGYLTVLMLHVLDLEVVVANFPEARARLRWAQVQIALMRGVQLIAKFTRELEVTRGLKSEMLTEDQRMELFADILQGKFESRTIPEDYLGLQQRSSAAARPRRLSSRMSSCSVSSQTSDDRQEARIDTLATAVHALTREMKALTLKVDRMSQGYDGSGNLSGSGSFLQTRTRSAADFGPVVRPQPSTPNGFASGSGGTSRVFTPLAPLDFQRMPSYERYMNPAPPTDSMSLALGAKGGKL